jgi:hypothetical protein
MHWLADRDNHCALERLCLHWIQKDHWPTRRVLSQAAVRAPFAAESRDVAMTDSCVLEGLIYGESFRH